MKLNIGAGKTALPGFEPWDIKNGRKAFPLDVPDNSVEEIYASHVLEHFGWRQTVAVLRDWTRALEPGGRLRVAVPDFDKIVDAYRSREPNTPVEAFLLGGQTDAHDVHHALFTEEKLHEAMRRAGLLCMKQFEPVVKDCSSLPISLNLEGFKPVPPVADPQLCAQGSGEPLAPAIPKAVAVWSVPRLGFMDTFHCVMNALPRLGIKLVRGIGMFWGQQMERIMDHALDGEEPFEYVLTLDFDSVFSFDDVMALFAVAARHPSVAAICAHQYHRAKPKPLWSADGRPWGSPEAVTADELRAAGELFDVDTANFGLALIRVDVLAKLPRPWFLASPNPETHRWDDGKTDADIHFWRQLKAAGERVCVAPRVCIGHAELDVRWPGPELELIHQHMYDYNDAGKPSGLFGDAPEK